MSSSSRTERLGVKVYGRLPIMARQRLVRALMPSYTVGSMTAVTRDDGAVLHVRHSYFTEWALPGGLVNRREPIDLGAIRETREEVGIEVLLDGEPAVTVDPVKQVVRVIYRAHLAPGFSPEDAFAASAEIVAVTWLLPDSDEIISGDSVNALAALVRSERGR